MENATQQPPTGGFNLSKWALDHPALTRYLMVVLMLLGVGAYFQLGQDEDPPFTFRAMVVRTYWPGATAQQVAEQVTDKLERTLQEVPYADRMRSYSKPGESQIIFELKDSSPPGEVPGVWYTVRKKIGDMRATLPQGVQGPFFNDEFGDVYGVIYAIEAEGFSPAELKTFADDIRQQLLRVKDVAKVEQFGIQDEKIYIEISQKRLAQLGLDMNQILNQLGQQNAVESAGTVQTPQDQVQIRVAGQFGAVEELRAMPIRGASGAQLRLGDIAEVRRGYIDPPSIKVRHQGREVVALGVSMAKGGDIIRLGEALHAAARRIEQTLPAGVRLVNVQDQPRAVSSSVNEFVKVLIEAVVIVLAVSFLSLGLHKRPGSHPLWRRWTLDIRPGLVVGITIPLVLAVTFLAMWYWKIGLHKISLGSLIIALGLLVDDAIIAVEMMVRKMEEGYDKVRAATFAYEITAMPMLTGTLITAAGFLPIGIAKSVTGEYTFAIFAVTVIALVLSWFVSVYFVPYLGTLLLRVPEHPKAQDHPSGTAQGAAQRAARGLRQPFLQHLPPRRGCMRGAPLDHHRRHAAALRAGHHGHGARPAAILPRLQPPGNPDRRMVPRGHLVRRERGRAQAHGKTPRRGARRALGQHLDRLGRAAFLPAAGPGIPAIQRIADHPAAPGPGTARSAAARAAGDAGAGISRSAGPRQAAAQRSARGVSGAVPRDRQRSGAAAPACGRGAQDPARTPADARRE